MRWIGLGVIAALLVTACASGCASGPPRLAGARAVDLTWARAKGGPSKDLTRHDIRAHLVGPHYSLGLAWVATGQALSSRDATSLGVDPVQAGYGEQLIVAAVDPAITAAAFQQAHPVVVVAVVNGATFPLAGLPLAATAADRTRLIEITAPKGASVALRVVDTGQSADLDLRTGAVTGATYHQVAGDLGWQGKASAELHYASSDGSVQQTVDATLTLGTRSSDAPGPYPGDRLVRANYQEPAGWAAAGHDYLTIPLPTIDFECVNLEDFLCEGAYDEVPYSAAFTFTPDGGTPIAALPDTGQVPLIATSLQQPAPVASADPAVFLIAAGTAAGTLTLDLSTSTIRTSGVPLTWTTPPPPLTIGFTFRK